MNVTTPWALLLLLFVPYFVWLGRPTVARDGWRRWTSVGLRLLIIALLTLALAGAQMVRAADELAVVFLVDGSDSMTPAQIAQAETFVRDAMATMGPADSAAVIVFGANALVERPMTGLAELAPLTSVPQTLHTDLAEAVQLGLALFPSGAARRMVVLSDGAATLGNPLAAARLAASASVQIDYVPLLRGQTDDEAWLVSVDAPTKVSEGETFGIVVSAESTTNQTASLRVLADGQIIYEEAVNLRQGINNYTIRLRAGEQSFTRYAVELAPLQDTYYQNNQLSAYTEIIGPPRVLLVTNGGLVDDIGRPIPDQSVQLQGALEAVGLAVDRVSPAGLGTNLAELSNYGTIVLVDINAKNLTPRKMETLQTYVRDLGGGLVAVGGPESYGMGGYFKTPLEETLPVDMQIKDSERFPSVSIVIVIDRSGSMGAQEGGLTKIQLAAEGAVRVVELLNDSDEITVIPVDTQPDEVIGPASIAERDEVITRIRRIGAGGGGIYVRTGIQAAANVLAATSNEVKHIIVLADGADSEEQQGVVELIGSLREDNVTVSMVSIGNGPDVPWLQSMAELGGGRFHFTDRAANLPQIFTQETTNIQRSYLIEERFFPTLVSNSPILNGITAVPPLLGYVGTSPKGTAQVILESHQGDPILAAWQYGLGRSVAWTSDATGRWATDWVTWDGFPVFWAQAVRWTITQSRDNPIETAVTFDDEQATLTVDARDAGGAYLDNLTLEANVVGPDGATESVTLQQIAPGRYETTFEPRQEGAYLIRVAGGDDSAESSIGQTTGWVLGYSPEYRQFQAQPQLLADMAALTDGRDVTDAPNTVFDHNLQAGRAIRPIFRPLLLLAVLLLPFDIAVRRLVVTKRDWEKLNAWAFGRFRQTPTPVERSERMASLFEAKQRASITTPDAPSAEPDLPSAPSGPATPSAAPSPSPTQPPPPDASTSPLAARLLSKKRDRQQGDGE